MADVNWDACGSPKTQNGRLEVTNNKVQEILEIPEDFDEFWQEARQEALNCHLDYRRSAQSHVALPGMIIESIQMATVNDRVISGWFAHPMGARRLPGFLWINPYGRESILPNEYSTRPGFASLNLNFFGYDAFYQEKYAIDRGYFTQGIELPKTYIYRQITQDCLVALRVLQAQNEVDEERIGAMGMSQGGGLAIACGHLSPIVSAVGADMPFLGDIRNTLARPVHRYPLKEIIDFIEVTPLGRERVNHTLGYFDTVYHASRCQKPTHVSLGLKDPACRPETVRKIFDALPDQKALVELDSGHDWNPEMIEGNRHWFLDHL